MLRRCAILMTALAVCVLLGAGLVPHHHHDGVWCAVVEHCLEDGHDNDDHTAHHGDTSHCLEEAEFVVAKASTQTPRPLVWDMQELAAVVSCGTLLLPVDEPSEPLREAEAPRLPGWLHRAMAMRAPPVVML